MNLRFVVHHGLPGLVGTGLVQLTGSTLTAILALGVLIYLNWQLTAVTIVVLAIFGGGMAVAFKRLLYQRRRIRFFPRQQA